MLIASIDNKAIVVVIVVVASAHIELVILAMPIAALTAFDFHRQAVRPHAAAAVT
jgi:hypothetical protein